jgi:hypothetical protein
VEDGARSVPHRLTVRKQKCKGTVLAKLQLSIIDIIDGAKRKAIQRFTTDLQRGYAPSPELLPNLSDGLQGSA